MENKSHSSSTDPPNGDSAKAAGEPAAIPSSQLARLYNREYFQGPGSSYPGEGYGPATVDWPGWLEIIQQIKPSGRLCDLGCAFGFLVELARQAGYQAIGVDISSFALQVGPNFPPRLVQANLRELPFPDGSFDIVSAFDVLEHVDDGSRALAEAIRILKEDGLIIGATPDPVFFKRKEKTHCFERPPSFWVERLEAAGFEVAFRFSGTDYNFQFLAQRPSSAGAPGPTSIRFFHHDYFGPEPDFVSGRGVTAVPRPDWGPLTQGARNPVSQPARVYLLQGGADAVQLSIRGLFRNPERDSGTLRISLDGFLLQETIFSPDREEYDLEIQRALMSRGGHNLCFEVEPAGGRIQICAIQIEARPADRDDFLTSLPFDLFQRYNLAARILGELPARTLLDVGGWLGTAAGHLASTSDFIRLERVVSSDLRPLDLPDHVQADGLALPFADGEFDVVFSLDVLEHVPPPRREAFLDELRRVARRWLVLSFPVQTPEVEEAEHRLSASVLKGRGFLTEHAEYGLPHKDLVEGFARRRELSLLSFPSGYLPHWLAMHGLVQTFSRIEGDDLRVLNQLYNRRFQEADCQAPCYRRLFLLGKEPLNTDQSKGLVRLLSPSSRPSVSLVRDLLADARFLQLEKRAVAATERRLQALAAVQSLASEQQQQIRQLRREVEHLKSELEEAPLWQIWKRRLSRKWNA